ncbi:MAG TPA: hypothetical protein VK508_15470 [Cyclobacteriaceae bacterium]|nr:hypothetical protein [Cyclobacteriaceae bacterium]
MIGLTRQLWVAVLTICGVAMFTHTAIAQKSDSVSTRTLIITPRLNSGGYFPFTGAYINKNVNVDVNVFYEDRIFGFFLFKSQDLKDPHSIINYLQPGIFKKIQFSPNFKLRFFAGYLFSQTSGFRDKDSDYYTACVAYWTVNDRFKLENTALFFDLSVSAKLANRFVLSYEQSGFKIDLFVWERVVFSTGELSTSASLSVNFPPIRLNDRISIQNTISCQSYLTKTKPDFAMRDGVLFQVSFPIMAGR